MLKKDVDGVTNISLNALKKYTNKKLKQVYIEPLSNGGCNSVFVFEGNESYQASGFNIGYCGEGPKGLHEAIKMFAKITSFDCSDIAQLNRTKKWLWTENKGFSVLEQ